MAQPYVGEIRIVAFNFAPPGWEFCNGQLLAISENEVLFNLIGTTYGGDGQETFALPNIQSRVVAGAGSTYQLAETFGTELETLTLQQIPSHTHEYRISNSPANTRAPHGAYPAVSARKVYAPPTGETVSTGPAGGSQPHANLQPHLTLNYIISLFGIYPQPN